MASEKVSISVIPHGEQPYPTVGDWRFDDDDCLKIRVSDMGNWKYEFLVALHELVEVTLCKDRGITEREVDEFDKAFEAKRKQGDDSEPGDAPDAPYRLEHFTATNIERLMAVELGVDWAEYEKAVNAL